MCDSCQILHITKSDYSDDHVTFCLHSAVEKRERERDFYSQEAGIQKGHAHQTWCLLFSNISMIFYTKVRGFVDFVFSICESCEKNL